jgi:hypothetical protein
MAKENRGGGTCTLGSVPSGEEEGGLAGFEAWGALFRGRRFGWGFRFGCWVNKKKFVWMFDGNRVCGVVDEPKPFSLMNGRLREPSPFSRPPPFLSLPDSLFESGKQPA